jgi:uncharacterized repeat protein (TIGR03803 family)
VTRLEDRRVPSGFAFVPLGSFDGANNGGHPGGRLALDAVGSVYGSAIDGGASGDGTIFKVPGAGLGVETVATFTGGAGGAGPFGGVVLDDQGNLYSTADSGGANGDGTVFEVAAGTNAITTLASFVGTNGSFPVGRVVLDDQGNLYSTADDGGAHGLGTVFEVAKGSNAITTLASFDGTNGSYPPSGVGIDAQGNLFGCTEQGGANGDGVIFEVVKGSNTITPLASFDGTNGSDPIVGLAVDAQGNVFGTTYGGGADSHGTGFESLAGSNTITTLASFDGANGSDPIGGVVLDAHGDLFGATLTGGDNGDGTVFEVVAGSGTITTLHSFSGDDGANPDGGVILDAHGNIFGSAENGGATGNGTVFELSAPQALSVAVASSNPAAVYGQPISFTATVTANSGTLSPSDTVSLQVDGTAVDSDIAIGNGTVTLPLPAGAHLGAGDHTVEADVFNVLTGSVTATTTVQTVAKAPLTVAAYDLASVAGHASPPLSWQLTGFVNGETAVTAGVTGAPTLETSATSTSAPGTYPITVPSAGTLSAANYDFPILTGATLTLTADNTTDFDGTGQSEMAVFRPGTAQWFAFNPVTGHGHPLNNGNSYGATNLFDIPVPGDYDGIGRTEMAVFRPSTAQWFVFNPITGQGHPMNGGNPFGATSLFDIPVPGDYDGIGRTEMAVFRPSTAQWFVFNPITGHGHVLNNGNPYGATNLADIPVPGDYDGIGRTEPAVFRPSTAQWFVFNPIAGHGHPLNGGNPYGATNLADIPVPGDYDGVGHTEMAVFRPSTAQWFVLGPGGGHPFGGYGGSGFLDVPGGSPAGSAVAYDRHRAATAAAAVTQAPVPVPAALLVIAPQADGGGEAGVLDPTGTGTRRKDRGGL